MLEIKDLENKTLNEKVYTIIDEYLFEIEENENYRKSIKENFLKKIYSKIDENKLQEDFKIDDIFLLETIKIALQKEISLFKKDIQYTSFRKNYNKKIYLSIFLGIILPLLLTGFVFDLKYKLIILLYIICSVIISSTYIIILEYINHYMKLELKIKD